jgi:tetratricopeptide (TPR) repeat protein
VPDTDSNGKNAPKGNGQDYALFGMVCALVILGFGWIAESALFPMKPQAETSYYNQLVQGFRAGQLSLITPAPPGLAELANPYDATANVVYQAQVGDMSYYRGKLYLYFGVTPAIVLFWPWVAFTGHYLSDADAIVIFLSAGFLIAAGLLNAIRRRYFPESDAWLTMAFVLALGVFIGAQEMEWQFSAVYQVVLSCAFAFTMASLAALWCALHQPKRVLLWLALASVAYGLAIGSRPSLMFGAVILLVPAIRVWTTPGGARDYCRVGLLVAAAVVPVGLIVSGILVYNDQRFGSPFEFGWHYQLDSERTVMSRQFSLHYLWYNLGYYFLQPIQWAHHFPFIKTIEQATSLTGVATSAKSYGGILFCLPVTWLALAAPLAWRGRAAEAASSLRWFIIASFMLFTVCTLTTSLYGSTYIRYELDFLPVLLVLSLIGVLGLEFAGRGSQTARRAGRIGWGLLLLGSVVFSTFASVEAQADINYTGASALMRQGRAGDAIQFLQKALALEPGNSTYHLALGSAYQLTGWNEGEVVEYQKALALDPAAPEAPLVHDVLGNYFFNHGQRDRALAQYQMALAANPNLAQAQYDLGYALFKMGRGDEAVPHLRKAQESQPNLVQENPELQALLQQSK